MVSLHHFFTGLILNGVVILLHVEKHALMLGWGCMVGLFLDHFQQLMVILYNYMPAVHVCVELLKAKGHQQTLSLNICILSQCH